MYADIKSRSYQLFVNYIRDNSLLSALVRVCEADRVCLFVCVCNVIIMTCNHTHTTNSPIPKITTPMRMRCIDPRICNTFCCTPVRTIPATNAHTFMSIGTFSMPVYVW